LRKEIEEGESQVTRLQARLGDKAFLSKAPAQVVGKERQRLNILTDKLERLKREILRY
jgi:valyl-tRNA synthetase